MSDPGTEESTCPLRPNLAFAAEVDEIPPPQQQSDRVSEQGLGALQVWREIHKPTAANKWRRSSSTVAIRPPYRRWAWLACDIPPRPIRLVPPRVLPCYLSFGPS